MPTRNEHEEKIVRNKEVSELLISNNPDYKEWTAVTAFYTVVHIIDKYLLTHPHLTYREQHPIKHKQRRITLFDFINRGIIRNSSLKTKYHKISNAAHLARYKSQDSFEKQFGTRIDELLNIVEEFQNSLV